jgi:hypothetical protein
MEAFTFRLALNQFGATIREAITEVDFEEQQLADFVELFASDFDEILSKERGEAIWRRDGKAVRRLGRYVGTLAEFFAVAPVEKTTVGTAQLMKAMTVIQPECKLRAANVGADERQEYCRQVSIPR